MVSQRHGESTVTPHPAMDRQRHRLIVHQAVRGACSLCDRSNDALNGVMTCLLRTENLAELMTSDVDS